jgi:tRNA threonylcarbamoyladenosine modification (KEOPS) complex  Pcc1 subunit
LSGSRGRPEATATIRIRYRDGEIARAVSTAVSPDNVKVPPGITIETETDDDVLSLSIACSRGIGSLVATVDDLLSCVQAAERAIGGVRMIDQPR